MLIIGLLAAAMVAGSGVGTAYLLTRDKIPTEVLDVLSIEEKPQIEEKDIAPEKPQAAPPPPPPAAAPSGNDSDDGDSEDSDDQEDDAAGDTQDQNDDQLQSQDQSQQDSPQDSSTDDSSNDISTEEMLVRQILRVHKNSTDWLKNPGTLGNGHDMVSTLVGLMEILQKYEKEKNGTNDS